MKSVRFLALAFLLLLAISCKSKKTPSEKTPITSAVAIDSSEENLPWEKFTYLSEDFSFEIDSSNISEFEKVNDTIFISVFPPNGIDIEERFFKILRPEPAKNSYALQVCQGRYFIDSMGPDPILDGMLTTGKPDTLHYEPNRGFKILRCHYELPEAIDTLAFIKSYKEAVGENLDADFAPANAKQALYEEFLRNDENMNDAFERLGDETHRIILTIFTDRKRFVVVFTFGHFA